MARPLHALSARTVATLTKPGRHSDGGGLYLNITASGARSWVFMWKRAGKRREMGLGSLRDVPLAKARCRAAIAREMLVEGIDPLAARDRPKAMTFGEAADALIESMSGSWRNAKHRAQWTMTLTVYCEPLRPKPVAEVGTEDVLKILQPLWATKPETASRLRGRIERVLDFARARGQRAGENPARWRGHLDALLPKRTKLTRGHHKAMPFDDVPAFMALLREREAVAALALEFAILTAARSGEVLGARWDEVNLDTGVWTVPAERMKASRAHRVPLSERAVEILRQMEQAQFSEFVFPGLKRNQPLSGMALEMVLRRMKVDVTVHGFRSAFRDWAGERTHFPREIAEAALAHLVGDAVERAYRRGDALEKRRELMEAWASFCEPKAGGTVVPIGRRAVKG
ncbi:tyrosine-type recombinase/integrase [Microvirga tunisiensis]|uniref:Tyrosine-type recombinase/integrase n=1 Tax=Microvirga tunisiensis TaxID=2108360 RepID=A0A5N7MSD7_9HYPH|nr:site-specific integrase [Microvirga tunisiensis]MPR11505.1 tyrosine-type recombinase/integrase [Microvirga tunisiensis]MPR29570.1 tyrosine-type recombinase/integrase [Microvirga tunisiensis]